MIGLYLDVMHVLESDPVRTLVLAAAFICAGVLLTQWAQLVIADRADVADQRREEAEDQAMRLGNLGAVRSIPIQRVSPEDGAL